MTQTPYLSVVAAARNDNHGGNMLRRMQIFINGLLEQCRRYQLSAELIIVEWNPPSDKPRLAEALTWSKKDELCQIRIIEVPPDVHQQFNHSATLPLFQMIAKNVGIRRARGEFVLATNIDLLFSDELFSFLASKQLKSGKMYRLDRYDVESEVPLEASLEEQLEYCKTHLIRINRRDGIETVLKEPEPALVEATVEPVVTAVDEPVEEPVPPPAVLVTLRNVYRQVLPTSVKDSLLRLLPKETITWLISRGLLTVQPVVPAAVVAEPATEAAATQSDNAPEPEHPLLHTVACGDFTLLSREDWFALRGYAEFEMYSFHIDSVFCYTAAYGGIEEVILEDPMRMYHIEHGGGWTPQTEDDLDRSLAMRKIPKMSYQQLLAVMDVLKLHRIAQRKFENFLNQDDWGLGNEQLPELVVQAETSLV